MRVQDTWWDRAECRDADPKIFETVATGGQRTYKEARALCKACPVQSACLDDVLSNPPLFEDGAIGEVPTYGFSMFQAGYTAAELNVLIDRHNRRKRAG